MKPMILRKPAADHTSAERSMILSMAMNNVLRGMAPSCDGGRFSGQQLAYAKGQAWKMIQKAGF